MFSNLDTPVKQILWGNILLILCCIFYLLWWLLAFNPKGGIKGLKSGWLLIPASLFGIAAVILSIRGIQTVPEKLELLPGIRILIGGIFVYILLLAVTALIFKRTVTTELLLIVGWSMLALAEISALYGFGRFSLHTAWIFILLTILAATASLICYILYYKLNSHASYLDGCVPLIMAGLMMAAISIGIV